MAVAVRAALIYAAAAVLPVSATTYFINMKYSDSACATVKEENVLELAAYATMAGGTNGCIATGTASFKMECDGGKVKTSVYTSADCSGTVASTTTNDGSCTAKEDEAGAFEKTSCGAMPSGFTAMDYSTFSTANCSGTETKMSVGRKMGECKDEGHGKFSKLTLTATAVTNKVYDAAGCTGTPNKTDEMKCGVCTEDNAKLGCAALAAAAGGATSGAAAVAPSMAAIVAMTSSVLVFA